MPTFWHDDLNSSKKKKIDKRPVLDRLLTGIGRIRQPCVLGVLAHFEI